MGTALRCFCPSRGPSILEEAFWPMLAIRNNLIQAK